MAARDSSGGVFVFGGTDVTIGQSIIAGNTGSSGDFDSGNIDEPLGSNLLTGDPQLAPLGDYGGPTQTMHPLAGSPAILLGDDTTRTDQRGFSLTGPPTIGAVKLGPVVEVTSEATLRAALAASASTEGRVIRFGTVQKDTITLGSSGQLIVPGTADGLFIDASDLPDVLTIDADQQSRVMLIEPEATVALHGLTLTGGVEDTGLFTQQRGAGIYNNEATLSLIECTISENTARDGGGIFSTGATTLFSCTLSGNAANDGGGIYSDGRGDGSAATLSLSACTLSGNSAKDDGGGIYSDASSRGRAWLSLNACTLSGNSAGSGGGIASRGNSNGSATLSLSACTLSGNSADRNGGGIFSDSFSGGATLSLSDTILAGNTAPSGSDLDTFGTGVTTTGSNLIGDPGNSGLTSGPTVTVNPAPKLSPLGHYGGPTQTMHPLAGSPAILSGGDTTRTDQRGFSLTRPPTIGAVKLGPVAEVNDEATLRAMPSLHPLAPKAGSSASARFKETPSLSAAADSSSSPAPPTASSSTPRPYQTASPSMPTSKAASC